MPLIFTCQEKERVKDNKTTSEITTSRILSEAKMQK